MSPPRQSQQTALPETSAAPAEKKPVTPRKPVKLTPPADVQPHPLEAQKTTPPPAKKKPAEPIIEDEELLVYNDAELPDFAESDFISFEEDAAPPKEPKKKAAPKQKAPEKRAQPTKQPRLTRKKAPAAKETPLPTPEKTPANPAATPIKEDPRPPAASPGSSRENGEARGELGTSTVSFRSNRRGNISFCGSKDRCGTGIRSGIAGSRRRGDADANSRHRENLRWSHRCERRRHQRPTRRNRRPAGSEWSRQKRPVST